MTIAEDINKRLKGLDDLVGIFRDAKAASEVWDDYESAAFETKVLAFLQEWRCFIIENPTDTVGEGQLFLKFIDLTYENDPELAYTFWAENFSKLEEELIEAGHIRPNHPTLQ